MDNDMRKKYGMRKILIGSVITLFMAWRLAAGEAVICDMNGPWLNQGKTVRELIPVLESSGYECRVETSPREWVKALRNPATDLVVYGNCAQVPELMAPAVRPFLERGGVFITGGEMPFWYIVDEQKNIKRSDEMVQKELANFWGGFLWTPEMLPTTALGKELTGAAEAFSGGRGICGVMPGSTLIELIKKPRCSPAAIVTFPRNGKFIFLGSMPLHETVFAPGGGRSFWPKLLQFIRTPLPEIKITVPGERAVIGDTESITVSVSLSNPGKVPTEVKWNAQWVKDPEFGIERPPRTFPDQTTHLKPGETFVASVGIDAPPAGEWGVYRFEVVTQYGQKTGKVVHWLPPAAIAYVDVNPVYGAPDRTLTVGVERMGENLPEGYAVNLLMDGRSLAKLPVKWKDSAAWQTSLTLPVTLDRRKSIVEAVLTDDAGRAVHNSRIGVENLPGNPAAALPDTMFRSFNGSQYASEGREFRDRLAEWRREYPLLRGLQCFTMPADMREWMYQEKLLCNYGQLLTNYVKLAEWGLDDCDSSGRSAQDYMPHHSEDVTSWLVRQHSRKWFQRILSGKPDIVNLVEAVAGYEPPGVLSNRKGSHGHFLGYAPAAVENYRRALLGRDAGVRMLDPGGSTQSRYHLREIYTMIYGEEFPLPEMLGFASWEEYEPLKVTLAQEGGYLNSLREVLAYRLHYLLRAYYHMMRLDDLSAQLRAEAPEVHLVIGHDGVLVAQISAFLYRLPYIDRQTRWLFRSAYRQAFAVTYGAEPYWVKYGKIFEKRVGLHEEIGAGQWAPYRTAETSFVSLFTKRAAIPYSDLQVDFYLGRDRFYRIAEEKAMYRGFQLAVDTKAVPMTADAVWATLTNNNSYYPENYRANSRSAIGLESLLRCSGYAFHGLQTPLVSGEMLSPYRVLFWEAERLIGDDFKLIQQWLAASDGKKRTLWINHAMPWHVDYRNGWEAEQFAWRQSGNLSAWGIPGSPRRTTADSLLMNGREYHFPVPLPILLLAPPENAQPLVATPQGQSVVWSLPLANGSRIVYSGLPFNQLPKHFAGRDELKKLAADLFASLDAEMTARVTPENWFACGYRLADGSLMVAFLDPAEAEIADKGPYGDKGDKVETVAKAVPATPVSLEWFHAGKPGSTYRIKDEWTGKILSERAVADKDGTLRLQMPVSVAKLYRLELEND